MKYRIKVRSSLDRKLHKLLKRNRRRYQLVLKKVTEITNNPLRYKNLKAPLDVWKRVHVNKHFVLAFSVDERTRTIYLEDFDHHDNIYKP